MISRRDFLQTSALGGLAIGSLHGAGPQVESDWIDAHVHVWTPDTKKYPIVSSFQVADMVPASFAPEELFAFCKPEGVTKIVLIQMNFYGFDNQYMLDCMEKHPGVFAGVAVIDETKSDVVVMMKKMKEKGVRGFRIYADRQKVSGWQDSSGMKQMWSHAADSGQCMCLLANPDALPLVIAMCERFPKTRVVVDHFARIGVSGVINPTDLDNLCPIVNVRECLCEDERLLRLGKEAIAVHRPRCDDSTLSRRVWSQTLDVGIRLSLSSGRGSQIRRLYWASARQARLLDARGQAMDAPPHGAECFLLA